MVPPSNSRHPQAIPQNSENSTSKLPLCGTLRCRSFARIMAGKTGGETWSSGGAGPSDNFAPIPWRVLRSRPESKAHAYPRKPTHARAHTKLLLSLYRIDLTVVTAQLMFLAAPDAGIAGTAVVGYSLGTYTFSRNTADFENPAAS